MKAYLQLFRIPNVFTAAADVMMGYLVTHDAVAAPGLFALLIAASCLLYTAGMVLNDVYDLDVDRRQRPGRPIPSGRIALGQARRIGFALLVLGVLVGVGAGGLAGDWRPGVVALLLAGCIWLYDGLLKTTPLAPLAMGACRLLNVLLGMSLSPIPWEAWNWLIAGGIGVYIVGVTVFARTEAVESSRGRLVGGTAVMLLGVLMLAMLPDVLPKDAWQVQIPPQRWSTFWALLAMLVGWRCVRAIANPEPQMVQQAVKQGILSLIVLDAVVCLARQGLAGPEVAAVSIPWVVIILLLLVPMMFLGRWIYST